MRSPRPTRPSRFRRALPAALLVVALALVLALAAAAALARPRPPHPFFEGLRGRPLVIAHQGGDRLWPSNTRYAFERAAEMGADVLELDVHLSSDGRLVVIHDDTLDRTTDASGSVAERSAAELAALDAGYRWSPERRGEAFPYRGLGPDAGTGVPTLASLFDALPGARWNVEIKPAGERGEEAARALCELVRGRGLERRVLAASFHAEATREVARACPELARAATPGEIRTLVVLSRLGLGRLYRPASDAVQAPVTSGGVRVLTRGPIDAAHRKGVAVHAWTIDEEEEMRELLALGVDGLITDRPDRALRVTGRGAGEGGGLELPDGVPY